MEGSWFKRVFVGGSLGAALLMGSAVLAQAQDENCAIKYNPLRGELEYRCYSSDNNRGSDLMRAYEMLGKNQPRPYEETMRTVLQNEAQELQNQILRLQLQELKRQQALRHDGAQQDPSAQRLQAEINRLRVEAERRGQR